MKASVFQICAVGGYAHAHNLVGHLGVDCERWNKSPLSENM